MSCFSVLTIMFPTILYIVLLVCISFSADSISSNCV